MDNIKKDSIRKEILEKRNALTIEEIRGKSDLIFQKLISMDIYKNARDILIYASMGSEVCTDEIISDALSVGKNVFCPKCTDTQNGIMEFIKITDISQLVKGYFGIHEPVIDEESVIYGIEKAGCNDIQSDEDEMRDSKVLMIMPLVAYDADNNRIGYKGGYYDRYLEKHPNMVTCALAFSIQKSKELIPAEAHDIKPQEIITEEN